MSSTWMFKNWIAASWDRLSPGRHLLLGIEQWIFRERSPFQEIVIARLPELGRGLFLEGNIQFVEQDEFVYHEHLALPSLLYHSQPKRVLIQGGGDGLALREVLRDRRVEEVVLVEIDGVVVDACREHLADLHRGSFDEPRAHLRIEDVLTYLSGSPGTFDIVLADLLDVYGPGSLDLYRKVIPLTRQALAPGGIVVLFGELARPTYRVAPLYRELTRSFKHVEMYRACIDSFACEYGFMLASDEIEFRQVPTETLRDRADKLSGPLKALVPEQFPAAFLLPPHVEEHLKNDSYEPSAPKETMSWIYPENQR